MVNAMQVPPSILVERLAKYLKENYSEVINPPEWSKFSKTGSYKEYIPLQEDWWYYRAASILRKLYKAKGPVGIERFRVIYGGKKRFGSSPPHFRKGSGAIARNILKQLEKAGLVTRISGKGRTLTPNAVSLLDRISKEIMSELAEQTPELKRYL
ncbi:30S ribosomal protein S19e [Fervidicoccus fontis]|jgi:small subunit ribosomal protein S19e|uniref:Small ribosomal subunit protein eS19 n=2 Tax=Fervidicoccus fontis TaxID=683846 RepID=I0A2N7_FERFK|nr:30S ribosomal protein S19e [Fervidicoccus fontis]AFH43244.1 30S ribosomal protein S19e [Fervidicoccus fontis Kam940]MBE9390624.1 30S ribosomal protein S19e [Fervidicoccus fontis]PMB75776.1 MAG: 30S ribosomal protein S19e [Fervidicoccus fontis]PMB76495.1 MAG: 30S ribosomal protein S19e [Fervidicoccus fontis]HEW63452.1 30S ribosomal protein S19e [Fervidicoccus fontis]